MTRTEALGKTRFCVSGDHGLERGKSYDKTEMFIRKKRFNAARARRSKHSDWAEACRGFCPVLDAAVI